MVTQYSSYSVPAVTSVAPTRPAVDYLIDTRAPVRGRRPGWAARVHVEVQAVLNRLGLRHALEVDARPAGRQESMIALASFRRSSGTPLLHQPGLPGGGGLGRALQLVAERIGPETAPLQADRRNRKRPGSGTAMPLSLVAAGSRVPDCSDRLLSGRTYAKLLRIVRVFCAVAGYDFACTFTRHLPPCSLPHGSQSMLDAGGAGTYTQPGPSPGPPVQPGTLHPSDRGPGGPRSSNGAGFVCQGGEGLGGDAGHEAAVL